VSAGAKAAGLGLALVALNLAVRSGPPSFPQPATTGLVPVVVVDPGHGWSPAERSYTGAYNAHARLYEDTFNLDIALRLSYALQGAGAEVYLTRSGDEEPPDFNGDGEQNNTDRAFFALQLRRFHPHASRPRADAYVSIHLNASRDPLKRGATVVFSESQEAAAFAHASRALAEFIHSRLVTVLPESAPPFAVNGLYMDRLALPHAVVEVVFITNRADLAWVQQPFNRQRAAELIAEGIVQWWWSWRRWQTPARAR